MVKLLEKLPKEIQGLIYLASDIAARRNVPAYLVGGFVRDLLLGVKNLDLDITVEGSGIEFAQGFLKILKARVIRYPRFGTATVIVKGGGKIDIVSARKESYLLPAQLPVVFAGTLKDDLFRRDFTVNAMAISIGRRDFGRLVDFFGGKADLRDRKIRILHNLSFQDDPTRLLRAIRFEKRYDFRIEPGTLKKIKEALRLKMLEKVQPQRLGNELILALKEECPRRAIRRMQELLGLSFISPRISLSEKNYRLLGSLEKQINWFRGVSPGGAGFEPWLAYFMGIIDALGVTDAAGICRKFSFRRQEEKKVSAYKKSAERVIAGLSRKTIMASEVFGLLAPLGYEAVLLLKAKYKNRLIQGRIENFLKGFPGRRLHISGDDLRRLGLAPGPGYQRILREVRNAALDGLVRTKNEELALAKKIAKAQ